MSLDTVLQSLGVSPQACRGGTLPTRSPVDGAVLAELHATPLAEVAASGERAHAAYLCWRVVPAPQRGELVRNSKPTLPPKRKNGHASQRPPILRVNESIEMRTPVDIRSDTVTRLGPAMRAAMQAAEVGDDDYCDDPTVNRLQHRIVDLFGFEAALYAPLGTQGNLIDGGYALF